MHKRHEGSRSWTTRGLWANSCLPDEKQTSQKGTNSCWLDAKQSRSTTHVYTVKSIQHVNRAWCYQQQQPLNPTPWSSSPLPQPPITTSTKTSNTNHQHWVTTITPTIHNNYITFPMFYVTYHSSLHTWTQYISGKITSKKQTRQIYKLQLTKHDESYHFRVYTNILPTLPTIHNENKTSDF